MCPKHLIKSALPTLLACLIYVVPASTQASSCGDLQNGYGPFDYNDPLDRRDKLPIVEVNHFTPKVQSLKGGITAQTPLPDIDYTLRAFPNHGPALYSMAIYQLRNGPPRDPKFYSAECYFDRALRFRPNDGATHLVYGVYLQKKGDLKNALEQYKAAEALFTNANKDLHYNLGLLYIEMKDYESALTHAKKAYALGHPLQGLKRKLTLLNVWKDD